MNAANTLVLASGNSGKLKEFNQLLSPLGLDVRPQAEFGVHDVEETGLTFVENALLKAREASRVSGLPALADDSGLEVDALNGAPGIYSARYAGEPKSDQRNNEKLLAALSECAEGQRTARYWCVLVYLRHAEDPVPVIVQRSWEGEVLAHPRGEGGFGYDPLFWLPDQGMSVAELPSETKNRLSHRGRALHTLVDILKVAHG
ncbi:dITP/XTP pyrophosphatase [Vreelandella aquamarina]|jgi:XTP/dITP diphosphohydrolase|uniref:dITP/XTP pyrophosphatase n=1 Tax=Vreelandella aquamarina TaxID=77097 RepID=A0A1N6DXY9_9GAMM|nr:MULTISPECIES: RdgB/HAM1 family non-canonical purine NTP pyrophosphatase [Halomonas]KTG26779.1 non-canonical purine NTP pyrophosphatase [Idiomarina sp. H105]MAG53762.1 non-canonical purine NTP pyrophosphatase, RdgB/HAM1 family [Halomonas sp.]MED5558737.1 RdgB/HAM1 family non-canonical purine NTP pyrophosphatase [Pseudomonadota bacterium]OAF01051.1 non-canonical purine NTP pyrophosphatase [Idiomarina sp. WRN-38]MCD1651991.1 RdgB/HAM1 family non-canonical purine NTP pyrophosphatase [Halomonas |tara:strand:- start:28 stop:636 length:609 start_codon:yes stop_codon:yes gene_type:complete